MIEYERITKSEHVRSLHLHTDNEGFLHGSSRFKGKTLDIVTQDEYNSKLKQRTVYLKRVTFGVHDVNGFVAAISEILRIKDYEPTGEDIVDHMLNQTAYENGWD
jgi:hypothetical protein